MMELKVGDRRNFSFTKDIYSIREIISTPEIKMTWTWDTCVCPECKHQITNTIEHTFYRIELLGKVGVSNEDLVIDSIMALGDTTDGRRMLLPVNQKKLAIAMSQLFNKVGK